jgi:hypothetical protein
LRWVQAVLIVDDHSRFRGQARRMLVSKGHRAPESGVRGVLPNTQLSREAIEELRR